MKMGARSSAHFAKGGRQTDSTVGFAFLRHPHRKRDLLPPLSHLHRPGREENSGDYCSRADPQAPPPNRASLDCRARTCDKVQVIGTEVAMQSVRHDQEYAISGIPAHPCKKRKDGAPTFS
jgi:hypothetical protein